MKIEQLKKFNLPDKPGVYLFKKGKSILYIGKATSLRDRVRSYFANDLITTRGPRIIDMITTADKVEFQVSDSVLEALILESALIKKHKPKYNIKEKDDKSYYSVIITDEKYPRVLLLREKELKHQLGLAKDLKIREEFGPFPNGTQLKEALRLIKKLFPFFDTKQPIDPDKNQQAKNHNLNMQINLYPDIYSGKISHKEYLQNIRHISLFFKGKKQTIVKELEKQMKEYVKNLEFEKANEVKRTLFAINHIRDVSLIKKISEPDENSENFRIESYDIAHIAGTNTVGVMTVMENGLLKKSDYRKFNIKTANKNDDYGALKEVLTRRLTHNEWPLPKIVVIDGGKGQLNVAQKIFKVFGDQIQVVSVVKDERHRPREILNVGNLSQEIQKQILQLNHDTHRFAIAFHRLKRKMIQ